MDTNQSVTERLRALAKEARSLASRDSRLFLRLGAVACEAYDLLAMSEQTKAFGRWCLDSRLTRSAVYKAMAAHRLLGDAPGAENQPRTVLELLGGSQEAADEARPLLVRRLTIREAQAIVRRHKPPTAKKVAKETKVEPFDTSVGRVALTFNGEPSMLIQALAQVIKQLQSRGENETSHPSATGRGLMDRLTGRAA